MENEKQDIIRVLAEKLRENNLPYKEGAWERFADQQKMVAESRNQTAKPITQPTAKTPVRSIIRPWMGVAAALLLMIGAGWYFINYQNSSNKGTDQGQMAVNTLPSTGTTKTPKSGSSSIKPLQIDKLNNESNDNSDGSDHLMLDQSNSILNQQQIISKLVDNSSSNDFNPQNKINNNIIELPSKTHSRINGDYAAILSPSILRERGLRIPQISSTPLWDSTQIAHNNGVNPKNNLGISNANQQPTKLNGSSAEEQSVNNNNATSFDDKGYYALDDNKQHRWNMGVMVVPGLSNDAKLNMGYGVSVGYQVSNRLSLNSGIAYTALNGSKSIDPAATIVSGGRALSSIDARVTGLNLPLEIRYHVNEKIYFGTGVSALAVLDDKVERKYAIAEVQSSAFEARNGHPLKPNALQSLAANIPTKEVVPENQVGSKDFAGYINFTFGFKQPLNKTKTLSIEPFLSIPMSNHLFNQNIKMTDGGIRIKLGL